MDNLSFLFTANSRGVLEATGQCFSCSETLDDSGECPNGECPKATAFRKRCGNCNGTLDTRGFCPNEGEEY